MSDLVGNPEDRFSRFAALIITESFDDFPKILFLKNDLD